MNMGLTNYWMLLLWLAVGGFFLHKAFPKQQILVAGKREIRWGRPAAILVALPYIIWVGVRTSAFGDTLAYRRMFFSAPANLSELGTYINADTKDKGFSLLTVLLKCVIGNSDVLFFLLIAAFQMLCLALVYRTYSADYLTSIFLFVASTDYLSWMFNGMRQFIAVAGVFACFGWMVKKKYLPLIAVILLCATIHASALIMLPIVFIVQGRAWNKKTLFFILCVALAILFVDQFTTVLDQLLAETQYSDMVTNEIWKNDDGTNVLRILVYSVPALLSLLGKRYVDEANDPVINICVNASACTMILYCLSGVTSGIYIGRLPIYTTLMGYIAVPWLIEHIFTKASAQLVKLLMVAAYVAFFYYQMHVGWNLL